MANSRKPGPLNPPIDWWVIPALTNGPLGFFDQGDPNVTTLLGDTPGPLGFNDANDPSMGPFGSVLEYAMFLSAGPFDSSLGIDSAEGRVAASVSAKPLSSAWARTKQSRVPAWNPAASDRVMGNLLANSERFADNKSAPGMWDRIAEKGKAVWDSTGEAVDDAGRALRRAVTIDSPAEARTRADEIALRRAQNQAAADLLAHGWSDDGLACVRLGSTAMAIQPASVNPAYFDSFDQRVAWSTNEALQLYAGGALIDAVAIPILTTGGKLAVRFLSQEAKLSHGLRQELRSSLNADLRPSAKIDALSQRVGGNKTSNLLGQKVGVAAESTEVALAEKIASNGETAAPAASLVNNLGSDLTTLRTRYAAEIDNVSTFKTFGVDREAADSYLSTSQGEQLIRELGAADPTADISKIYARAVDQLGSGSGVPELLTTNSPLVKIVPQGQTVSPYSPFFTTAADLNAASKSGYTLADYFGLPVKSEATLYDIYQISPNSPAKVFVSEVARTTELGGLVSRPGGAMQYVVANRSQWSPPTLIGTIEN